MTLKETENQEVKEATEKRITNICLNRLRDNLAGILIFGSYNTGEFVLGKSDIDLLILLKEDNGMKFQKEEDILKHVELTDLKPSIVHFRPLEDYKEHIYREGAWSSWITIICGSKVIYSTEDFEKFRTYLEQHPLSSENLKDYIKTKDYIELEGYFKRNSGWNLTKAYYSHLRRKLQILNFLEGNTLDFDFTTCLNNLDCLIENKLLQKIEKLYKERKEITEQEVKKYYVLAKKLTKQILEKLK
ncbi:MAG: nucleotidyltransferase domain-containing protein [Nanoarchaeota archaeon]|nr:nucleotidyltransferase domain-containing protein [Nanoarchaeota archaeon]MBU1103444.1 nucleotidyltransferase domain-containing protein [Nanoarchaeota archaeon]